MAGVYQMVGLKTRPDPISPFPFFNNDIREHVHLTAKANECPAGILDALAVILSEIGVLLLVTSMCDVPYISR